MKVNELIKLLCDFNPEAEVEIIHKDLPLTLIYDYGWDCGGDSEVANGKSDAKTVSIWAMDEVELNEKEMNFKEKISEITNCKGTPIL